jgi:hypothetical protein
MRSSKRLVGMLVAAAALAAPGAAHAATFCVATPSCPAGATTLGTDLQAALDAAAVADGADVVLVGDKGSPYVGPFTYQPLSRVPEPLELAGSGPGRPLITAPPNQPALTISATSLHGIDVHIPNPAEHPAIEVINGRIGDVTVSVDPGTNGGSAVVARGATTFDGTRILGQVDSGLFVASSVFEPANVILRDVTLRGAAVGISTDSGGLTVERSRISAVAKALNLGTGDDLLGAVATVRDTALVTSDDGAVALRARNQQLTLDHVTFADSGAAGTTALALSAAAEGLQARLSAIAIAGYEHGIVRPASGGSGYATSVRDSVWDAAGDSLGGLAAGAFTESGNAHVAPALVDLAGGDLRPRGGSAAIDRDGADPARYSDVDGVPAGDGDGDGDVRADAGAFEYRRRAPLIGAVTAPARGVTGVPLQFAANAADADGDRVALRWDFGDGAGAGGGAVSHAYATAGSRQVVLTATDDAGLTDRRTLTLDVAAAPTGAGDQGAPPPAPDVAAPVLSDVRLSARRIASRRARTVRLRFALSERATLRLIVLGRTITRTRDAGPRAIALGRALERRGLLRPGRLKLKLSATDAAGNRSPERTVRLVLR